MHFMQSPSAPEVLCNRCGGKKVIEYQGDPIAPLPGYEVCSMCNGSGYESRSMYVNGAVVKRAVPDECSLCKGDGIVRLALA